MCAFHVVPYTKMTALVFDWLQDTLSDSLQPEAYNLHVSSFFFKCYFRVNIFAYSSHTVSNYSKNASSVAIFLEVVHCSVDEYLTFT